MANAPLSAVTEFLHRMTDAQAYTASTDSELVKRFLTDKDEKAFVALLKRHGPMVLRLGRHILGNDHDVEDIFQATFLLLARKAKSIRKHQSVASWLYGVTNRLALNMKRREAARQARERQAADMGKKSQVSDEAWQELQTALHEALAQLPEKYRAALLICYLEGKTQHEAARQLGCPVGTISSRLARGRDQLQKLLQKRGLPLSATALAVAFGANTASAAVEFSLVRTTAKAALEYASGQAATALVSAKAATLVEEGLKAMMTMKLTVVFAVALLIGTLGVGAGAVVYFPTTQTPAAKGSAAKGSPAQPQAKVMEDPPPVPRVDRFGDPLPPGALNRLGSQVFRHPDTVHALVYAPDGKAIASACADGSVRLWDAATAKLLWRLEAAKKQGFGAFRKGLQHALAFSSDGKKLAMLNDEGYIVLDTVMNNILVRHKFPAPEKGGKGAVSSAIAADLSKLAFGFDDGSIRLVDAVTGQEKMRFKAGEKVAEFLDIVSLEFSPDGKTIYAALEGEGIVRVFDTATGKLESTLKGARELDRPRMVFSRGFHQLAVFGRVWEPGPKMLGNMPKSLPARLALWDLKSGKEQHVIDLPLPDALAGAFSPDGKLFAVVNAIQPGNIIVIFDTATGQEQRRMRLFGNTHSLAFTPDGNTLAAGEIVSNINLKTASITLRSVATGELQPPLMEPRGGIVGAKFRPGGKQLLTFGADGVYWWDVATGQSVRHLEDARPLPTSPPFGPVAPLGDHPLSPDEKILATRGADGDLMLLGTATNQPLRTLKAGKGKGGIATALFSPDGAKLFTAGSSGIGSTVTMWEVASGKPLMELENKFFFPTLAVSPDGRWLAFWSASFASTKQLFDGYFDIHLWDLATGKLAHRLKPRYGPASAVAFSADSTHLVIVGGELGQNFAKGKKIGGKANEIQVWDVATGKELRKFQSTQEHFVSLAISPDGRMIATGKWKPGAGDAADPAVKLWDVATGTERGRIQGHESLVNTLDFSPDSRLLAAASADAPIYIWDVYALEKSQFAKVLTKKDKDKLWQLLAEEDAAKAFQAVRELIARPVDAVAIFQDGWKRVPRATVQQMQKWMEDLDSNQFAVRQQAQVELDRYIAGHETLLANALEKANTLELRQRLEAILNRLHSETLRRTRMLEVLERIGVGPARQFLQTLAGQTDDADMSREAKAGLNRLES